MPAGNGGPSGPDNAISPLQVLQMQLAQFLRIHLPMAEESVIEHASVSAAKEAPLMQKGVHTPIEKGSVWGVEITRRSALNDEEEERLVQFGGPRDLRDTQNVDEVISSTTIHALMTSAQSRALLYAHGYNLHFFVSGTEDA